MQNQLKLFLIIAAIIALVSVRPVNAGTLSCSVTTAAACTGTVTWRMSGATNAHAELPSQATAAYDSNVVCCSGVTGLGNACTGTFATALKLSGVTNAHVQQTGSYAQSACISVPSGGSVSVGYQATNCTGFDTTLGSMTGTTNAHVGNTTAYTTRICGAAAGAAAPTLTFSISDPAIGFSNLDRLNERWATGDGAGSATEVSAHTLDVSTNATNGYVITVNGNTLTSGANTVTAIGATAVDVTTGNGTEQFGIRLTVSGVGGSVTAPYNGAANNYALDTAAFPDQISSGSGDGTTDTYSVFYAANISAATKAGTYTSTLTYIATGTF
jgi:hypothetical protein